MNSDRPEVVQPHTTHCPATYPAHPNKPCMDWVNEFNKQAKTKAGGGLVKGRVASGGMVAAKSVSDRAAESMRGVHRCAAVAGHVEQHVTAHMCWCRFEWTDSGPVIVSEEE